MQRAPGHLGQKAAEAIERLGKDWTGTHVLYMFYSLESFHSRGEMYAYALFDTAIGRCGIAWGPRGIIGVQLPEKSENATRTRLMRHCPSADELEPPKQIARGIADIAALLSGEQKSLRTITLDMSRTPTFNARVYETTRAIAPGMTRTYGEIARAIGDASAARAVGQALSRNPFAIVVPCHRVVGADFKLTGFSASGGIATNRMLQIEGWRAKEPMLFEELV